MITVTGSVLGFESGSFTTSANPDLVIGICSLCGGAVVTPTYACGGTYDPSHCRKCGAKPAPVGVAVIPMVRP